MKRSASSFTVRHGIARIQVWRNFSRRGDKVYCSWEFRYTDENGQAKRCNRADKKQARAEAHAAAKVIAEGAGAAWTAEETAAFRAVKRNLDGCGVSPDVATFQYRRVRERLADIGRADVSL